MIKHINPVATFSHLPILKEYSLLAPFPTTLAVPRIVLNIGYRSQTH